MVDIANFARIVPMVNQVETHVLNQQTEAKRWMDKYEVQIEAWAPFGEGRGNLFTNEVLTKIGEKYQKSAAQVMLRWNLQRGVVVGMKMWIRYEMIFNHHPQIHIVDFDFLSLSVFNQCENSNDLLMCIDEWANVHPLLKVLPVEWDYRLPFGLLHAPQPTPVVERFLRAVEQVYGK